MPRPHVRITIMHWRKPSIYCLTRKPGTSNLRSHRCSFRPLMLLLLAAVGCLTFGPLWAGVSAPREGLRVWSGVERVTHTAAPVKLSNAAVGPTLGNYPNTTVTLGASTTVAPDAAPITASINVSTSTSFKGTFSADPSTGVVRVTNAHPSGAYTVTVRAFDSGGITTTKTFTLTVEAGAACAGASVFTNAANLSTGSGPVSVAVGDFNNDGKQDIAAANYNSSNTVSIRLGNGAGNFSGTTDVGVGTSPAAVAVGDFNNDGKQDFAAANQLSATVSIRLGDGLGGFTGMTEVSVGSFPVSVAVGDFNNDGKQDIAAVNSNSNTVSIRLGDGAGNFSGMTEVNIGTFPISVAVGDFNEDGKQDIAVANSRSATVSIRLGDGLGGFTGMTEVSAGTNPYSVAVGDFNNDSKQDIAIANFSTNTVSIRLGNGAGNFSGTTDVGVGTNPISVAVGDFNNDGKQDIAAANYNSSNTVSIRLGNGAGNFSGTTDVGVGTNPISVAVGDFNNDGKQDFAAAFASTTPEAIRIRLGQCNPTPTIAAATGLSRQQGSAASNSQIATATDDGGNGNVIVTVTSLNPTNGVTISNIVNTEGNITADIIAGCGASDANFTLQVSDGASTTTAPLTVTVMANTAPTLAYTSPQSVTYGNSLTVMPTVASDNGNVTYQMLAGHGLTTAPTVDANGVVSITNAQPVGTHTVTIQATDNCGTTTDALFSLVVAQAATTTAVMSSVNPSALGRNITFTATVASTAGTPTGTVQFKDGGSNIGVPVALNGSGVASISTDTLNASNHTITADYSGDTNFATSTGNLSGGQQVNIETSVSINDVQVAEGNSSITNAVFTVTLSTASNLTLMVDFATANGTATSGSDYQATSGTLIFAPNETQKTITVVINGDTLNEDNETFFLNLSNPQNATTGDNQGLGIITNDDGPGVQFGANSYQINEGATNTAQGFASLSVDVTRTGDTSQAAAVKYFTSDSSGGNECNQVTGQASQRCDYTTAAGTLRFAAGESTRQIQIPVIKDGYVEGNEVFSIQLQNPVGATLGTNSQATITIVDSGVATTPAQNPYLSNELFVRMSYLDFLAREPDTNGFADWTNVLNNCGPEKGFLGAPPACDRPHVSHGFFGSPEFTDSGFLIYRIYEVGMNRLPRYAEFTPDMATLSGFGQQNLQDYLQEFSAKQEFTDRFGGVSQASQATQLIEKMEQTAGVTLPDTTTTLPGQPTQYGRTELIQKRSSGQLTVAETLKAFVEQKAVYDKYFPRGQVTMLYFAHLRRDPDLNDPNLLGWTEWVDVFTNGKAGAGIAPRDIHHLIFGFIYSEEYRKRFGQP
jgi:hypothetical protein